MDLLIFKRYSKINAIFVDEERLDFVMWFQSR